MVRKEVAEEASVGVSGFGQRWGDLDCSRLTWDGDCWSWGKRSEGRQLGGSGDEVSIGMGGKHGVVIASVCLGFSACSSTRVRGVDGHG